MVVQFIGIEVHGDHNFIIAIPHPAGGFQTDFVSFFGCNLAGFKALASVIVHISAQLSIPLFGRHHMLIPQPSIAK